MSDQKIAALKPFCPLHHWRMVWDNGSARTAAAFRCAVEKCNIRYTSALGYFEAGKNSGDHAFLARVEVIRCEHHREHQPAIVGYIKEAQGHQTEEWRQWHCFSEKCGFSTKQKLSTEIFAATDSQHRDSSQPHHALAG